MITYSELNEHQQNLIKEASEEFNVTIEELIKATCDRLPMPDLDSSKIDDWDVALADLNIRRKKYLMLFKVMPDKFYSLQAQIIVCKRLLEQHGER